MDKNLGRQVVAEGVESHEQQVCLRQLKCPQGQGLYLGQPLPPAEFTRLCHRREAQTASSMM
jgi:EAL domain-containing protein (putative c-di-GMP-specific phosphodiesterase class I)